jgi:hypothetical protein
MNTRIKGGQGAGGSELFLDRQVGKSIEFLFKESAISKKVARFLIQGNRRFSNFLKSRFLIRPSPMYTTKPECFVEIDPMYATKQKSFEEAVYAQKYFVSFEVKTKYFVWVA